MSEQPIPALIECMLVFFDLDLSTLAIAFVLVFHFYLFSLSILRMNELVVAAVVVGYTFPVTANVGAAMMSAACTAVWLAGPVVMTASAGVPALVVTIVEMVAFAVLTIYVVVKAIAMIKILIVAAWLVDP